MELDPSLKFTNPQVIKIFPLFYAIHSLLLWSCLTSCSSYPEPHSGETVKVRDLYEMRRLKSLAQQPQFRSTPYRLSVTGYPAYLHLLFISRDLLVRLKPGNAPRRGDTNPLEALDLPGCYSA
jgi:hypothetical protein